MCLCIEAVATLYFIYGVAFHYLINKRENVSFSPYLDQLIKNVVFPYSLLYMTERIVHAATVTNGYVSIIQM